MKTGSFCRAAAASLVVLFSVLICVLAACGRTSEEDGPAAGVRAMLREDRRIIHAYGMLTADGEEYTYTNSREALRNVIDNSDRRFIEVDLCRTTDGLIVCGHH